MLQNCFHFGIEFNCTEKFIKNFAELGLISVILIGRWMLPRGELTRDQLSALLIGYVNTAADLTGRNYHAIITLSLILSTYFTNCSI